MPRIVPAVAMRLYLNTKQWRKARAVKFHNYGKNAAQTVSFGAATNSRIFEAIVAIFGKRAITLSLSRFEFR